MTTKRSIQQVLNLFVAGICIISIAAGIWISNSISNTRDTLVKHIEQEWRQQAKRTLSDVSSRFERDVQAGNVNPNDELSLQQWAKQNISGILNGGDTGDTFMVNLGNEKFVWDGSPDCAKPEFVINGRYLKDEAPMHYDQAQAEKIINIMRLGNSTLNTNDDYWWNFDGSPEYLEWVVEPPGRLGFGGESYTSGGVKNPKYTKILIALGTQKDEVEKIFEDDFKKLDNAANAVMIFTTVFVIGCICNMIIFIYLNKKKTHLGF